MTYDLVNKELQCALYNDHVIEHRIILLIYATILVKFGPVELTFLNYNRYSSIKSNKKRRVGKGQ